MCTYAESLDPIYYELLKQSNSSKKKPTNKQSLNNAEIKQNHFNNDANFILCVRCTNKTLKKNNQTTTITKSKQKKTRPNKNSLSTWICPGTSRSLIAYKTFTYYVDTFLHFVHNSKLMFILNKDLFMHLCLIFM